MGLEAWRPGAGVYALALPVAMTAAGARGFVRMQHRLSRREHAP